MSTPYQPPETEPEANTSPVFGTTRFTVTMMRWLRVIRIFHGAFGLIGLAFALLSLACGGAMGIPQIIASSTGAPPGMSPALVGPLIGIYVVSAIIYGGLSFWLLLGAYHMQMASWSTDATSAVERALRDVAGLWATITLMFVATIVLYAGFIVWIVSRVPTPPMPPP